MRTTAAVLQNQKHGAFSGVDVYGRCSKLNYEQTVRRHMRFLVIITLSLLTISGTALANKDRRGPPRTVSFTFSTNEHVTFEINGSKVLGVTVQVGNSRYSVPETTCTRLRDIHFNTVSLGWSSAYESVREAGQFYVQFNMGPRRPGPFGDIPPICLHFRDGKFARATGIDFQ